MTEDLSWPWLKKWIVGRPIPSHLAHHERLSKTTGLAILSSDALSSVAYATEEVVRTLILAGVGALWFATPISLVIAGLLLVVVLSYRQTIHAYPGGGGAFIVTRENIGTNSGLVAAAALMIDYVLTVAVSIAAGVAAITSAFPELHVGRVPLALVLVAVIALGNLRGVRESGRIFAIPTYFFVVCLLGLIAIGVFRAVTGQIVPVPPDPAALATQTAPLGVFLVLRAFANGCTAMTGVEAVADGVPAFRPPEPVNAAKTLLIMGVLAVTMFVGITLLTQAYGITPVEHETVVSQLARAILGGRHLPYYAVQASTTLILVLAANTAYSDFPRLASILARERFLARQFLNQGDRLAFSNGIIVLSALAGALIVIFGGDTHALIPLYMIGVFVSFTLSQSGMVKKRLRERGSGWQFAVAVNGVGATLTGIVLVVVAITKFGEGAWVILLLIPIAVVAFRLIHSHYAHVASQLTLKDYVPPVYAHHTVIVPISGLHRAVVEALLYAKQLSSDVRAVYVDLDPRATEQIRKDWDQWGQGTQLVVLPSPYRSLMEPLLEYIEQVEHERPDDFLTVVMPEFVVARWWQHILHNQRAWLIKVALLFRKRTVLTSVPYHLKR